VGHPGGGYLESAISRLYGGIHYRFDIERGVEQGRCVGRAVNALAFCTAKVTAMT
jgi:hypothetical protein